MTLFVYVLDVNGKPLMPTNRYGKVRRLLKNNLAKVVNKCPFTIQLLYETADFTQPINLGIDAGSKYIGISATTKTTVLFEAEVTLRNDIVDLISTRRELRRNRRNRKTRYREPRFLNRVSSKKKGWLAPSIKQKINTHLSIISKIYKMLPINNIIVEVATFDIQKIKNPNIQGKEYQQGEQLDSWNVREYVLFRDNHTCQCCKGKSKDKILNTHHIESRKTGGNAPNNLITLCKTCHGNYHKGKINLPKNIKRGMKFNDATFMGIMRWAFYNQLKLLYPNVLLTYGYITKHTRITHNLSKTHYVDARCISNNPNAQSMDFYYKFKKLRRHNRQIHKAVPNKKGVRQQNQAPYLMYNFRLFDKVVYNNRICFITGRRQTGYFALKDINYEKVGNNGVSYKKLHFIEPSNAFMCHYVPTTSI
jgi:5-methylcytosine-specific restriction endonuclease McrA